MKKNFIIIYLLFTAINVSAQKNLSTKDSISTFYNKLLSTMKAEYLYKDKVDWPQTESELNKRLQNHTNFKSSLKEITFLFDEVNAGHCSVHFKENVYNDSKESFNASDFSGQWIKKFKTNPTFEVKVLDNQYGYILMPSINVLDSRKVHKIAQPLYDEINRIKKSKKIKNWIVDLRFNSGGSCEPMILSLYDLLGDNNVWGMLDINKKIISRIKHSKGKYKYDSKKSSYINPEGELLDRSKVAIITGIATASSGEVTAMAFKGRPNTVFIGEKTYGATTANQVRDLSFGAYMALTVGYDCDRNGEFYERIVPDIEIKRQDNFDDLLLDGNIKEAIKYIEEK